MTIDWWTLALQTVNFLVLVYLLQRFLYKPVRRVIERRRKAAEKAFDEAEQAESRADNARESYEKRRRELTEERERMMKDARAELEEERKEILERAREEADETIRAARGKLAEERRAALATLRERAADLAVALAGRVLRESGAGAGADSFLERIAGHLEGLSKDEREALGAQVTDGGPLRVVTARELDDEGREHWRERLRHYLGPKAAIEFEADPDLIAGAELHFPHAILHFTWRDALETAARELKREDDGRETDAGEREGHAESG